MTSGIIDATQRWLPNPRYLFVGGPYDGQTLVVDLHETAVGRVPPRLWRLFGPLPKPNYGAGPVATEVALEICDYRFVQRGGVNIGHYEFCAAPIEARQGQDPQGLGSRERD